MIDRPISRRRAVATLVALAGVGLTAPRRAAAQIGPTIHVLKDPGCGCCSAWIDILARDGFTVTTQNAVGTVLFREKAARGIPPQMASCHTADVAGYVIEGHVPPADIRRLLSERPDAIGLAVPGMPYGSPGMGPEARREAYDVHLIRRDGATEVFTSYAAGRG